MKKRNTEEKVKVYDDVIKLVRDLYPTLCDVDKNKVEEILPELKESEYEKIRKALVEYFTGWKDGSFFKDIETKKILSWLEKQKERNPANNIKPKFKVGDSIRYKNSGAVFTIKSVYSDHYSLTNNEGLLYFMFQDRYELVEKKQEWSEDDLISLGYLATFVDENGDSFYGKNKPNVVKWIRSFANLNPNQKQEWSEEDEYCRHQLIVFCENCMMQDSGAIKCADWLKNIKDRVQIQPKREWSEGDQKDIENAAWYLRRYAEFINGGNSKQHVLDLADRIEDIEPKPRWKPTKEQMYVLNWVANIMLNQDSIVERDVSNKLQSLYEQLKQLEGE